MIVFDHKRINHDYLKIRMYFNKHINYESKNGRNNNCFNINIKNLILSLLAVLMKQLIREIKQRKDKLDNKFKLKTKRMKNDLIVVDVNVITLIK